MHPTTKPKKEVVILVHGFGGKKLWMRLMASRLQRFFEVKCFSYPTLFQSIENHARKLTNWLERISTPLNKIHIVAHSMGAIVSRAAINTTKIKNLDRFVMLAPPNSGSPFADLLSNSAGRICKPIRQLSSNNLSFVNQLPNKISCQSGIIAAKFDALVPIKSTLLPTVSEHVVLNATHNSLLFSNSAALLTTRFLHSGSFQ